MSQLSVFRNENKYLLTYDEAASLKQKLSKILPLDSYSKNGPYLVRSLYLDSIGDGDFHEKMAGTEIRKKIRLRVYSPDDTSCKLEVKQKNGDLQHKVSLWITRDEAIAVSHGDFGVLSAYFDRYSDAPYIYTELVSGIYRPKALVEYDRLAFMHELFNTRITFDTNVRSSESCFELYEKQAGCTPVFNNMAVLEVKYNDVLIDDISRILKSYNLTRTSFSKYCLSRKVYFDL